MSPERVYYTVASSRLGEFALAWIPTPFPRVTRVFIPKEALNARARVRNIIPEAEECTEPKIDELARSISLYLEGRDVRPGLDILALDECKEFQRRVLLAEYGIPRGWVSTYERIANYVGSPRGSRAVGRTLATNPFPIVIPCHRAVRSDGGLGGYQGGIDMKRKLLDMEGVRFTSSGRVIMDRLYY